MGGARGDGSSGGIMTVTVSAAFKMRNNIAAVLRPCADDAPIAHPGSLPAGVKKGTERATFVEIDR